ncbi:MAG: Adenosylcobinamide-phosphate guanylyltransferase [Candidatus Argoarchaeum ethanivorans]|uniref:Adenosylcobinamide-phosphate guanylyltransferase n=1 Tax=Candidatus Argoarchaeum ethanivorans TaxID=2608793 RepID=A0A811TD05_9EURY|nr:MAG: Adenosylcobinamide-phosphate guanylyltransferase [Candidatus Argoarchaeum ethanivorans]
MDAFIMAGGRGTRLNKGEKPLLRLLGKPLITYSIDVLKKTSLINQFFIITSSNTPGTTNWLAKYYPEIPVIKTPGEGYVPDMVNAVKKSGVKGALLVIMSDLPLITPTLIERIIHIYKEKGTDALSVHLPIDICKKFGQRPDTVFHKDCELIVPVGINILNVDKIDSEQEDYNYLLDETNMILNVNTIEDYYICKEILNQKGVQ